MTQDRIYQLLATDLALDKLGARDIAAEEAEQLLRHRHVLIANPRADGESSGRRLLVGETAGGRRLTLVVEATIDPGTWLIVTGWESSPAERTIFKANQ